MENKILNLLKKIIKEDEDTFIDITDMDDDSAAKKIMSKKDIFKKLRNKMSDKDRTSGGYEYGEIVSGQMGEELTGGQSKIDVAEPKGKITAADFKKLRDGKKSNKSEVEENIFKNMFGKKEDPEVAREKDRKENPYLGNLGYDYDDIRGFYMPEPGQGRFDNRDSEDGEMEEGNAFSGALEDARKKDKPSFEVDGKTYPVKEDKEEKFIQKATEKMEKKGTSGKFGAWCKSNGLDKDGEVTKKCIDKAMKSDDSKVVKMANFANNIGGFKGAKHESVKEKIVFTESELINFIERLVEAEKVVDKGFKTAMTATKKENTDAIKQVADKMKKYMKNMGTEYEENPQSFPKGNKIMSREDFGKEVSDDKKNMYTKSDAVEEYIEAFSYPGQTNLVFDEIKPDDTKIEKYLKGHSTTGNAQVDEDGNALGNVVPSEVGEKFYKNYKDNLYGAEQMKASYKRQPQPIEIAGEEKSKGSLKSLTSANKSQKIFDKLEESVENKKVISEMEKMKNLIGYNRKTQ